MLVVYCHDIKNTSRYVKCIFLMFYLCIQYHVVSRYVSYTIGGQIVRTGDVSTRYVYQFWCFHQKMLYRLIELDYAVALLLINDAEKYQQ